MKKNKGIIVLIVLLAIPVVWLVLWKNTQFGYTPLPVHSYTEFGDTIPITVDTFTLTDQNGKVITRDSIGDRVMVANFFFASCKDICPVINSHIKLLTQKMSNNSGVVFLSFSVDPTRDTTEVLNAYAQDLEINSHQWHLLTGSKRVINDLAHRSFRVVLEDVDSTDFVHTDKVVLIDKEFRVRGYYNGLDMMNITKTLAEDIRFLLKEYKDIEQNEK